MISPWMIINDSLDRASGRSLGYSRRKGLKSFGCVFNMACDLPTGLFVSVTMTQFWDSPVNAVKVILQQALHVETTSEIQMNNAMIDSDQGYNDDQFLRFCSIINAPVFFYSEAWSNPAFSFWNHQVPVLA